MPTWHQKTESLPESRSNECFCGHDCARCVTFLATVRNDGELRAQAQRFYRDTFGLDLPAEQIRCLGGRSEEPFCLCADCPWKTCCRERGLSACRECPEYPCPPLAGYREKYVSRCNQLGGGTRPEHSED